ncbi:PREDICTED: centromere protein R isoform X3 [Gavialis gangeticus]|uniref:centromere protein R isoform X3 n=1 Tax=Gavialis gangeticus TaxID=94835 RepID=UPI00092E6992|nr:PREDICTED: centromere protein R isoform X3 [Gavialis gangeticus]
MDVWMQSLLSLGLRVRTAQYLAKRALKLESYTKENVHRVTPLKTGKKNLNLYSPLTGTCQIGPFSSPTSHNVQKLRNGLSNGERVHLDDAENRLSRRGQPQTEVDKFMELHSEVENSLERFLKIRQNLTSLQALGGSKELENIISISASSSNLKTELQKTRMLKYSRPVNSYEFFKSLLD